MESCCVVSEADRAPAQAALQRLSWRCYFGAAAAFSPASAE